MSRLLFIAILLTLGWGFVTAVDGTEYEVVQIVEYCRHGARTNFKKLPYMDLVGLYGPGILTATGMR